MQLFTAQTADGNSAAINWEPGDGLLQVDGTFDSGSVAVQVSLDGGTTYSPYGTAITTAGVVKLELPAKCKLRLNLSSAGASTELNAFVVRAG